MKEITAILQAFAEIQHDAESIFLATVVNVQGSTYRRPGARMLMMPTGRIIGTISAGCLENDVFEHTRVSMPDGRPIAIAYDSTADEDILWGFGLGCNGLVQVLIERLESGDLCNPLLLIQQCFEQQQPGVIATVFAVDGAINVKVGDRLIIQPDNNIITNITESTLKSALINDTQIALKNQKSTINKYQFSSGIVDVFIEIIQPPTNLIIFGAGQDALPTVQFAKALGWRVTIVDCRANEATKERFAIADEVILSRREILHQQISVNEQTVAVVMTHNYLDDLAILKMLLPSCVKYLGILGPKRRSEKLLDQLQAEGGEYSPEQLEKLHSPVGLDIGADTPEAIALSIIAEIQAVLANRSGGFLRNRALPIHQPHEMKEIPINALQF
ncbi:putative xanthine dehydrogenase accessory factor [Calothrix sp. NIES-2100]|uniref:XdhC family protein n=1 Tax=Calothrix sp. NIES-2100 TaxID=1954172 RepID=UPI000B616EE5|nr:putative xanthine dehydrogenase accessory factor [Calothrix sp. NIES-2100]